MFGACINECLNIVRKYYKMAELNFALRKRTIQRKNAHTSDDCGTVIYIYVYIVQKMFFFYSLLAVLLDFARNLDSDFIKKKFV